MMNYIKCIQMGGDLIAMSDFKLVRTAEFSVFFLYNDGVEVALIPKGGKRN